jgi:hypothetical protein
LLRRILEMKNWKGKEQTLGYFSGTPPLKKYQNI